MALIQCRDCEKEISKRAYFCPNCGGWTKHLGNVSLRMLVVACALAVLAVVIYFTVLAAEPLQAPKAGSVWQSTKPVAHRWNRHIFKERIGTGEGQLLPKETEKETV